jgi:hypothetical protein
LYVEELSPDDMGYDGDVEVVRPDVYEEAESDFEDNKVPRRLYDTDDDLARHLRGLSCEAKPRGSPQPGDGERGRKRRSTEMNPRANSPLYRTTEIEISEIVDDQTEQPPTKRRRKRDLKPSMAQRAARRRANEAWSDSEERSPERRLPVLDSSNSGTPRDQDDAMDLG